MDTLMNLATQADIFTPSFLEGMGETVQIVLLNSGAPAEIDTHRDTLTKLFIIAVRNDIQRRAEDLDQLLHEQDVQSFEDMITFLSLAQSRLQHQVYSVIKSKSKSK